MSNRESLRAQNGKLDHIGVRGRVSRATLADANEKRDWRIYADFAEGLIRIARLYRLTQAAAFFVIRAKPNFRFRRLTSRPVDKTTGLRCDQSVRTSGVHSATDCPDRLRRIKFRDRETGKTLPFLTNSLTLPALTIVRL